MRIAACKNRETIYAPCTVQSGLLSFGTPKEKVIQERVSGGNLSAACSLMRTRTVGPSERNSRDNSFT